jgi:hypothetical protein
MFVRDKGGHEEDRDCEAQQQDRKEGVWIEVVGGEVDRGTVEVDGRLVHLADTPSSEAEGVAGGVCLRAPLGDRAPLFPDLVDYRQHDVECPAAEFLAESPYKLIIAELPEGRISSIRPDPAGDSVIRCGLPNVASDPRTPLSLLLASQSGAMAGCYRAAVDERLTARLRAAPQAFFFAPATAPNAIDL